MILRPGAPDPRTLHEMVYCLIQPRSSGLQDAERVSQFMNTTLQRLLHFALTFSLIGAPSQLAAVRADTVIEAGGIKNWRFLDDGTQPDAAWRQPRFDDSKWISGRAPLGYGETRLKSLVRFGRDAAHKHVTTWFRGQFEAPNSGSARHLVLSVCVDDGAVIYLNGKELGRVNMPDGPVSSETLALQAIGSSSEGFYVRLHVPSAELCPGQKNVLAVEVHQASVTSSDLFFDLELKVGPAHEPMPAVPEAALDVTKTYNQRHYVGPNLKIPDGYVDGGRRMVIDAKNRATSDREILQVDRVRDVELARDLAVAGSREVRDLPVLERIQRIAALIDAEATPPGGPACVEGTAEQLEREFRNQSILIGDWMNQGHAGVCRHRSLLFKILADEAGLNAALVRGNYAEQGTRSIPHAWNEVFLGDGRRVLIDVSLEGSQPRFLDVGMPEVVEHYLKVDNRPWYGANAD
jgi:hypothetical protein